MLSGETAKGEYPIETLKIMHYICREAESASFHWKFFDEILKNTPKPTDPSILLLLLPPLQLFHVKLVQLFYLPLLDGIVTYIFIV